MNLPAPKPSPPRRKYQRSRLHAAKAALSAVGAQALDGRSPVSVHVSDFVRAYAADLGGMDTLGTGARKLLEAAGRTDFLLLVVDAFIFGGPSRIINRRRRALYAVVRERQQLIDSLSRLLGQLGLERKARRVEPGDLASYLAEKAVGA